MEDLTGQRFGKLTVISFKERGTGGHQKWLCKCDCGREAIVDRVNLIIGKTKSCGCLRKKVKHEDLVGQRFGQLLCVDYLGTSEEGHSKWKCLCDCGNKVTVYATNLKDGTTTSCGCYMRSLNQSRIKDDVGLQDDTCVSRIKKKNPTKNSKTGVKCVFPYKTGYRCVLQFQKQIYRSGLFKTIEAAKKWRDAVYDEVVVPYLESIGESYKEKGQ